MAGNYGKQVGRLHIRVLPKTNEFRDELRDDLRRIERELKATIKVEADTTKADEQVRKFVNRWDRRKIRVSVTAITTGARAAITTVARDRNVTLNVQTKRESIVAAEAALARLSGFRVVSNLLRDVNEGLTNLDQKAAGIARVSLMVANLSSVLVSAAVGAVTVAGDLAKIGNLGLVLPAAFAGAAIGITTLVIALKSAKTELASIGPAYAALQGIIQSNFWEQAKQPILDLANSVLPSLRTGFASVAQGIGAQLGTLASAFQRTLGGGVLDGMFLKLRETIDIVTTGMNPLAEALTTLGTVGSQYLPRLATFFVQIGTAFNDWVQKSAANGDLFKFIEEGITAAKDLGRAISGIVGILRGIDSAATAAGAGGLASFADNMQGAAAILNSPAVQGALTTIISGVRQGLAGIGGGLANFGDVLIKLAPVIATVLASAGQSLGVLISAISSALSQPEFAQGLLDLFDGIYSAITSLAPAFPAIGQLIGQLGTSLGVFLSSVAPLLAVLKTTFAPLLDAILVAVTPLIPVFAGALVNAVTALIPAVESLSGFIADNQSAFAGLFAALVLGGATFGGLVTAFAKVSTVVGTFKQALNGLKAVQSGMETAKIVGLYGVDFVKAIASGIAAGARFIASLVAQGAAMVAAGAKATAYGVKIAAMKIAGIVSSLASATAAIVAQGAAWTAAAARTVAAKAALVAVSAATKIAAAAQWVLNAALSANPIGIIIALIVALVAGLIYFFTQTELGQQVWASLTSFISDAIANIQAVIGAVVGWIAANWQTLLAILLGPFGLLIGFIITNFDAIKAVVLTFIANVVAAWNAFWTGLATIVSVVWSAIVLFVQTYIAILVAVITAVVAVIVGVWNAFWSGLATIVGIVWSTIVSVVTSYIALVVGVITTVVSTIQTVWSTFWAGVASVVSAIWSGISSIVSSAINTVRTIIANVLGIINAVWTGNWSAIGGYVQNILGALQGFISGALNTVRSVISSVMNTVLSTWRSIWNQIGSAVSSIVSGVQGFVSGLVSSVASAISGVFSTVSNIQSRIMGVFSGAASWLAASGRSIIQGLIDGITGMAGRVKDAVGNVLQAARNLLPFSPAKEGPFSGKGWTLYSGRSIADSLADGMEDRTAKVRSSALRMMNAIPRDVATDYTLSQNNGIPTGAQSSGEAKGGDTYNIENLGYDPAALQREADMKKRQSIIRNSLGKPPVS